MNCLGVDLKLKWLTVLRAPNKLTSDLVTRANLRVRDFFEVWDVTRNNDLQGSLTASIVELNEEKVLTAETSCSSPSTNTDNHVKVGLEVAPQSGNTHTVTIRK